MSAKIPTTAVGRSSDDIDFLPEVRMRCLVGLVVIMLMAAVPLAAQELPVGDPVELGFAPDRLARLSALFQGHVEAGRIAGAEGLILRRGEVAFHQAWGYRDLETRDALEKNDIFSICSMTKPVTSVAVMMLWEEGRFALTDPVSRYLPEFAQVRVARLEDGVTTANLETAAPRRPITIQDLLRHTSGLTYGLFANTVVDSLYRAANPLGSPTLEALSGAVASLPLREHPGARWTYSMSTDVLARLVEVVSGTPFDAFVRTRIFEPLGMKDTHYRVPQGDAERVSKSYRHAGADAALAANPTDACASAFPGGGAGLASTARDYARFAQMLLAGGALYGTRLLAPGTVELMTTDHLGDVAGPGTGWGFGLGFAVKETTNGDPASVGTYYWEGLLGTSFWIDPAEELIGIFMVQIYPNRSTDFKTQFQQLVYAALVK